tara:strand:+ start:111 stop:1172 length:1062 start_codon:yes stop_codon:yes gene_type:complete
MRILVTGGAGFIGSHTCLVLLEQGYEIVVIDSFVNSSQKSLDKVIQILKTKGVIKNIKIEIVNGDIRDEKLLDKLFLESINKGKPFYAVIHFAGLKSVRDSTINPLLYWDVNVNGAIKLLGIMNKYKCRTMVFSSSATIYGLSGQKILLENSEINPINPYGVTKAVVEKLLKDIYDSNPSEWRIANLRYFNPIGAHSSGMIGESPIGIPNNIFPYLTQVAAGRLDKLTIFGNDWPTTDGSGVRDYIHVMDLAEGHISALKYLIRGKTNMINLNLGTGLGTSVIELVNVFEKVNKVKIPIVFGQRRLGDCATVIADNSLAVSLLDWLPKRTLEEMCIDGWRWQLLNAQGYQSDR